MATAREWALELAQHDLRVFPCYGIKEVDGELVDEETGRPPTKVDGSGKRPRVRWKEEATTDPDKIEAWFDQWPDMNYGVVLGEGVIVLDADSDDADDAFLEAWDEFEEDNPLSTFKVRTARGYHYYFAGSSRTFKLQSEIDLKGAGGYVVGPGCRSWSGGWYGRPSEIAHVASFQQAPDWIVQTERDVSRPEGSGEPLFISENRNNTLTKIAGALCGWGIDKDTIKKVILEMNANQTYEPLDREELESSVFRSLDTWAYGTTGEAMVDFLSMVQHVAPAQVVERRFFDLHTDIKMWPEPQWLAEGHLQHGGLAQLHGPSYTGKTFVAIDLAMRIMNHRDWFGMELTLPEVWDEHAREDVARDYVLYFLSEGSFDFRQRLDAWVSRFGGDYEKLVAVTEKPLDLSTVEGWTKVATEINDDPRVQAVAHRLGLIILDTQSMLLGANELDNTEMSKVATILRQVSNAYGCTILMIHHDPYTATGRIGGRGASSFGAAMDATVQLGGTPDSVDRTITFRKVKGARLPTTPYVFRIEEEGLSAVVESDQAALRRIMAQGNPNIERLRALLEQQETRSMTFARVQDQLDLTYAETTALRQAATDTAGFRVWQGGQGNRYNVELESETDESQI